MIIFSDISDISDWERIAGGFPCRDVARERNLSDSFNNLKRDDNPFNPREAKNNNKVEILEDNINPDDELSIQCPISIISAERNNTKKCPISTTPVESSTTTQVNDTKNNSATPLEENSIMNFPVYEILDSSDEAVPTTMSPLKLGNDPPIIRRSSRNVGTPKFYGKRYFIDVVDLPQVTSGSASNPIILDKNGSEKLKTTHKEAPLKIVTVESHSSLPNQNTSSSTDESIRIAVDNFHDYTELDSELFNAKLENFKNCYRNC